ncbi:hypothetical protein KSF78_0008433 [Schistosoma japonicum]|nr:hypothetical protein KSF78_0008433 [Schistosoma japonicum]
MREEIRRHYPNTISLMKQKHNVVYFMLISEYSFTLRLFTFHHKDFARKAIEYSEQCTASLKQIFSHDDYVIIIYVNQYNIARLNLFASENNDTLYRDR